MGVLAKGIGVKVNGLVVGTVLTTGQARARSPGEDKYLAGVNQSLWLAGLGGLVLASVLGLLLARPITRPVLDLTAATRAMAQGRL